MPGQNPLPTPLPADLPENWSLGQIVSPSGVDVGLTQQHGYNCLMEQVNKAQEAANAIGEAFPGLCTQEDLDNLVEEELPEIIQQEAKVSVGTVILPAAAWSQDPVSQLYTQPVTIPGLTADSKVDFDAGLSVMAELPASIQPVNDNGSLSAVTLEPPETDIQVQVTITNTQTIAIQTPPVIVTEELPQGIVNQAYTATLAATGTPPFTWSLTGGSLPDGLSLSQVGVISGTPTAEASAVQITVQCQNTYGSASQALELTIAAEGGD